MEVEEVPNNLLRPVNRNVYLNVHILIHCTALFFQLKFLKLRLYQTHIISIYGSEFFTWLSTSYCMSHTYLKNTFHAA